MAASCLSNIIDWDRWPPETVAASILMVDDRYLEKPHPARQNLTEPDIFPIKSGTRARTKARLRMLRRLPVNHDNEGAAAPDFRSIDQALAFIDSASVSTQCLATLDDDGSAVIELKDRASGSFGDITFKTDGTVECYQSSPGSLSRMVSGELNSSEIRLFLAEMGVSY